MFMQLRRREFLKRSALGFGAMMAGASFANAAETQPAAFDPFEKVALGRSGLTVPRFCLGTGMDGSNRHSNHTRLGQDRFTALVRGAHERGVRMFDSADLYGTHSYLVSALKGIPRGDYCLVSKIWWMRGGLDESERPDADVVVPRFLK
jgi:1-deoxyxylulose-5-phosphate synthase